MPIYGYGNNGAIVYYDPPPPPPPKTEPPKTGPTDLHFHHILTVALHATTGLEDGHGNVTTVDKDWAVVQEFIANQYRNDLNISDAKERNAKIAALTKQYDDYFKGHSATGMYDAVVNSAEQEAQGAPGESPSMRTAETELYNAQFKPTSQQSADLASGYIAAELQRLYGNGNNGIYTASEIKTAVGTLDQQFAGLFPEGTQLFSDAVPTFQVMSTDAENGRTFGAMLSVLTNGLKLTPAEIKSRSIGTIKLSASEISKSGTLVLTSGEAQELSNPDPDPVTLALLKTAGINIGQLSPPMAQLAKASPQLFFYAVVNHINISVVPTPDKAFTSVTGNSPAALDLGNGQSLDITINGKPITVDQLPPAPQQPGTNSPPQPHSPTALVAAYLGAAASSRGSGTVTPGVVAVANALIADPSNSLHLQVTPTSLSKPSNNYLEGLSSLAMYADAARTQYANTQLRTLLAQAPDPTSKNATAYLAKVITPFLTTQLNGFFSNQSALDFWNNSPVQNATTGPAALFSTGPAGWTPPMAPTLQHYMQTWLAGQFTNLRDPNSFSNNITATVTNISEVLSASSPEQANMLVPMLETEVGNLPHLQQNDPRFQAFFDNFSQAAQIGDAVQLPGAPKNATAAQIANWMKSLPSQFANSGWQNTFEQDTALYGYTDLPNALTSTVSGGVLAGSFFASGIQSGEQQYETQLENQLGKIDYNAFEADKTQTLSAFFGQFSNKPGLIGTPITIGKSDTGELTPATTSQLTKAIETAYGFSPSQVTYKTVKSPNGTVHRVPTSQEQILNIDLNWINSQSIAGSTVTVVPFLFASPSAGTQTGVFFDISNSQSARNNSQNSQYYKREWTGGKYGQMQTVWTGPPPQVLIDGSAAQTALQMDASAWQHPQSVDVKWHYTGLADFQGNNDLYQGGTIYTPDNLLGIGSNGVASSTTDIANEVTNDVVNAALVAGVVLAPATGGLSLTITGTAAMLWGTYQAFGQYDDYASHGEQFTWGNPGTRGAIIQDGVLGLNWATLGVGTAADGLGNMAANYGRMADIASDPALAASYRNLAGVTSKFATGLTGVKTGLELAGYAAGYVQTESAIGSFISNIGHESWSQSLSEGLNVAGSALPFFMEPIIQGLAHTGDDEADKQPPAGPPGRVRYASPAAWRRGAPDPLTATDEWLTEPVYFAHTEGNTTSYDLTRTGQPDVTVDDPGAPWGTEEPPSEVRIWQTATGSNGEPIYVASHYLARNKDGYNGSYLTTDGRRGNYTTGLNNPFDGLVLLPDTSAAPDAPDPLTATDEWLTEPVYFAHTEGNTTSYDLTRTDQPDVTVDDPGAPWGTEEPPSEVRIWQTATGSDGEPVYVASHYLTRNEDGNGYNGSYLTADGRRGNYTTGLNDPFDGLDRLDWRWIKAVLEPDPLDPTAPEWGTEPVYFAHTEGNTTSYYLDDADRPDVTVDDPRAPWGTEEPPSEVRIWHTATDSDGETIDVAAHYLTRNEDGNGYNGRYRTAEGRRGKYTTGLNNPFDGLVLLPDTSAAPDAPDPLTATDEWLTEPVYFAHTEGNTTSYDLSRVDHPDATIDDPGAPWGTEEPPSEVRIWQTATRSNGEPIYVASHYLTRNNDGYNGSYLTADGRRGNYTTGLNNPFDGLVPLPDGSASPDISTDAAATQPTGAPAARDPGVAAASPAQVTLAVTEPDPTAAPPVTPGRSIGDSGFRRFLFTYVARAHGDIFNRIRAQFTIGNDPAHPKSTDDISAEAGAAAQSEARQISVTMADGFIPGTVNGFDAGITDAWRQAAGDLSKAVQELKARNPGGWQAEIPALLQDFVHGTGSGAPTPDYSDVVNKYLGEVAKRLQDGNEGLEKLLILQQAGQNYDLTSTDDRARLDAEAGRRARYGIQRDKIKLMDDFIDAGMSAASSPRASAAPSGAASAAPEPFGTTLNNYGRDARTDIENRVRADLASLDPAQLQSPTLGADVSAAADPLVQDAVTRLTAGFTADTADAWQHVASDLSNAVQQLKAADPTGWQNELPTMLQEFVTGTRRFAGSTSRTADYRDVASRYLGEVAERLSAGIRARNDLSVLERNPDFATLPGFFAGSPETQRQVQEGLATLVDDFISTGAAATRPAGTLPAAYAETAAPDQTATTPATPDQTAAAPAVPDQNAVPTSEAPDQTSGATSVPAADRSPDQGGPPDVRTGDRALRRTGALRPSWKYATRIVRDAVGRIVTAIIRRPIGNLLRPLYPSTSSLDSDGNPTDPRTGEVRTLPQRRGSVGTKSSGSNHAATVDLSGAGRWAWLYRWMTPRDAYPIEAGRRYQFLSIFRGASRHFNYYLDFVRPDGATAGRLTDQGEALRALGKAAAAGRQTPDQPPTAGPAGPSPMPDGTPAGAPPSAADPAGPSTTAVTASSTTPAVEPANGNSGGLDRYINVFRKSDDPAIRQLAETAGADPSLDNIEALFRKGLASYINLSRESVDSKVRLAARKADADPTPDNVMALFKADLESPFTGSKDPGELSGNAKAVLEQIFDTSWRMLASIRANAPELDAVAREMVIALAKRSGLVDEQGTEQEIAAALPGPEGMGGKWTKQAKAAVAAFIRYGLESPDINVMAAAKEAQGVLSAKMRPGRDYTEEQLEAIVKLMAADWNSAWVGGEKIMPSARGELSRAGSLLTGFLKQGDWTDDSASVAKLYVKRLLHSPDETVAAAAKYAKQDLPKSGSPILKKDRDTFQALADAEKASWARPKRIVQIEDHMIDRLDRNYLGEDVGVTGNLTDTYFDIGADYLTDDWGPTRRFGGLLEIGTQSVTIGLEEGKNRDFIRPNVGGSKDPDVPSHPDLIEDRKGDKQRPWVTGSDHTVKVARQIQWGGGPSTDTILKLSPFGFLADIVPISLSFHVKVKQNDYLTNDELGNPGMITIPAGTELTDWEAQHLERAVTTGYADAHKPNNPPSGGIYRIYLNTSTAPVYYPIVSATYKLLSEDGALSALRNAPVVGGIATRLGDRPSDWVQRSAYGRLIPRETQTEPIYVVSRREVRVGVTLSYHTPSIGPVPTPHAAIVGWQWGALLKSQKLLEPPSDSGLPPAGG
jgi:hypothetical protein